MEIQSHIKRLCECGQWIQSDSLTFCDRQNEGIPLEDGEVGDMYFSFNCICGEEFESVGRLYDNGSYVESYLNDVYYDPEDESEGE